VHCKSATFSLSLSKVHISPMNILGALLHSFFQSRIIGPCYAPAITLHPRHRPSPYCHLDHSTLRLSNSLAPSYPFRVPAPDSLPHPSFCTYVATCSSANDLSPQRQVTPSRTSSSVSLSCIAYLEHLTAIRSVTTSHIMYQQFPAVIISLTRVQRLFLSSTPPGTLVTSGCPMPICK